MEYLTRYRPAIKNGLVDFLKSKQAGKNDVWLNDFLKRLAPFAQNGKLLRGCLVCYSYRLCSGKQPDDKVINAAMAIELAHSALLIQDDVMDEDEYRRGSLSLHAQYARLGEDKKLADTQNFGTGMAICGSDIAIFFSYELLSRSVSGIDANNELQAVFSSTLSEVCQGQMQDIYLEGTDSIPDKKAIYELMEAKTASYSVALPLIVGAILAGAPQKTKQLLRSIGTDTGIIFQIRDDELGALGNQKELGKPVGSDIMKAKKTLLYYYLSKKCSEDERIKLGFIFGNQAADASDISYVQAVMRRHNIPKLLAKDVADLQKSALGSIKRLGLDKETAGQLKDFVEFCSARRA